MFTPPSDPNIPGSEVGWGQGSKVGEGRGQGLGDPSFAIKVVLLLTINSFKNFANFCVITLENVSLIKINGLFTLSS